MPPSPAHIPHPPPSLHSETWVSSPAAPTPSGRSTAVPALSWLALPSVGEAGSQPGLSSSTISRRLGALDQGPKSLWHHTGPLSQGSFKHVVHRKSWYDCCDTETKLVGKASK